MNTILKSTEPLQTVDGLPLIYCRPNSFTQVNTHYCPGCTHGVIHRLVAEVLDELGVAGTTVGVASVGCSVFAYNYFDLDFVEAPHGRAPAMATGVKRCLPDRLVFTYQGDGDLASIGMGEIVHAAARGENITVIFVNNAVYGMTGGQMAPTTPPNMRTTSSPSGRNVSTMGWPIRMSELLATLDGPSYIVRRSTHDPVNINRTKKAIKLAFQAQLAGLGFSMVEVLSSCPTNWEITPKEALKFVEDVMVPYYPLGDYKMIEQIKTLGVPAPAKSAP